MILFRVAVELLRALADGIELAADVLAPESRAKENSVSSSAGENPPGAATPTAPGGHLTFAELDDASFAAHQHAEWLYANDSFPVTRAYWEGLATRLSNAANELLTTT